MKKTKKKKITILLIVVGLVLTISCGAVIWFMGYEGIEPLEIIGMSSRKESPTFEYVLFGEYPQSQVSAEQAIVLDSLIDKNTIWTSYEYYSEDKKSDFFLYTDVTLKGERYRAVCFNSYRQNAAQPLSGYEIGKTYWFKFEPIEWRVLKDNGDSYMLIANIGLDSQPICEWCYTYNGRYYNSIEHKYAANYYETSYMKTWLNETFYNTAFSSDDQAKIIKMKNDNVYLLSENEYLKEEYYFDLNTSKREPTDYAMSQGAIRNENGCFWWLSTSDKETMSRVDCVYTFGYVHTVTSVDASICVVPVIYIQK